MKKITLCNTKKYKNQAGMNLTPPPPPSQTSHAVRWHCTAESERSVVEIRSDFSVVARLISKLATEFRKEDATRDIDWAQLLLLTVRHSFDILHHIWTWLP